MPYRLRRRTSSGSRPELAGDVAHDGFDQDHALRAAEAAKRGVALGIASCSGRTRSRRRRGSRRCRCETPRGRRPGRSGRREKPQLAASIEFEASTAAGVVEAHGVFVGERMALAGDHEVIVAVQAQLDRPAGAWPRRWPPTPPGGRPGFPCRQSRRPCAGTRRAPRGCRCPSACATQCCTSPGCWVLEYTTHWFCSIGTHVGDLAFEVEVLLAADFQRAAAAGAARAPGRPLASPRRTNTGGST